MEHFTDALFENLSEGLFDSLKKVNKAQLKQLLSTNPVLIYYERQPFPYGTDAYYAVYRVPLTGAAPYYAVGTKSTTGLDIEYVFSDQDNHGMDRLWNHIISTLLEDPEDCRGAYDYQDPQLNELKMLKKI
jgi:hypothetical protein